MLGAWYLYSLLALRPFKISRNVATCWHVRKRRGLGVERMTMTLCGESLRVCAQPLRILPVTVANAVECRPHVTDPVFGRGPRRGGSDLSANSYLDHLSRSYREHPKSHACFDEALRVTPYPRAWPECLPGAGTAY